MASEGLSDSIETRISSMYEASVAAHRAHLEDTLPPFEYDRDEWVIGSDPIGQFFTTASKIAQGEGIRVRINFVDQQYPNLATLSYASPAEHQRERSFLDEHWDKSASPLKSILLTMSDSYLTAAAALQADVPVAELLWGYMHLDETEVKNIEGFYSVAAGLHQSDPDLFYRLILKQYMSGYVDRGLLALMEAGQTIDNASKQLNIVTGRADEDTLQRHDARMTDHISRRNYMHMGYRTIESLVQSGYTPLDPTEYESCVRQVFSR